MYMDDIVMFSKAHRKQINHVRKVLILLPKVSVTIISKKRRFFKNTIDYLEYVIRPKI